MRGNKYGVRRLSGVHLEKGLVYFWVPPVSLQRAGTFKRKYLGRDFRVAVDKARDLNVKLDAYRVSNYGVKLTLTNIDPGTVGYLVREFEFSPRYARYSYRTRQDYSWMYRSIEVQSLEDDQMFGEMRASEITRQFAYALYEKNVVIRGHDSANKAMSAWSAAFRYGLLKHSEIRTNPFANLDKLSSPPRRQRWTNGQIDSFIKKADELRFPSVGRCALMCMELMQRPGDSATDMGCLSRRRESVGDTTEQARGVGSHSGNASIAFGAGPDQAESDTSYSRQRCRVSLPHSDREEMAPSKFYKSSMYDC